MGQSSHLVPNLDPGMNDFEASLHSGTRLGVTGVELEQMLIDERMKSETHKSNYKTLEAKYLRLEDKLSCTRGELKHVLSETEAQQEQLLLKLAELQEDLMDKSRELEELRQQVLTPQRLDLLRIQVQQEMETPVREKFDKLEEETENYRTENEKLRQDLIDLQSQLDHEKEQHMRVLEERSCEAEAERQLAHQQTEPMEKELRMSHQHNNQLSRRLHKCQTEVSAITSEIESLKCSHKLEVDNIKIESMHSKVELEKERDKLLGQIDGLQEEGKDLKATVGRLLEKEQELVKKMLSARDEEMHKIATLHEEKCELKNRLAALEHGEESAHRELQNLRTKLHQQSSQLERQNTEIADGQQQNFELRVQLVTVTGTLDRVREELRTTRDQAERTQHEAERLLEDRQVEWLEEKNQLQQKYSEAKEKMKRAVEVHKKETERYKLENDKLRHDYTVLQSQLDHEREEHAHVLGEKSIWYEAEISSLKKDKTDLVVQYEESNRVKERKHEEALQREEVQIKAERQSVRLKMDQMEKDVRMSHKQNNQLTRSLHKSQTEVSSLTREIESLKCSQKLEVDNIKMESTHSKGELEKERDKLLGQIDGLQGEGKELKATVERLVEKEREMVKKMLSARDKELHKIAALHKDKYDLKNRLAALEHGEESACRELQTLRSKLHQESSQLEKQNTEVSDLQQQNQELRVQLATLTGTLDRIREELRTTRDQAERSQHEAERLVEGRQVEWLEEKNQLQQKYSEAKEKIKRAAEVQKKRKEMAENQKRQFQNKIDLLEAKNASLELEVSLTKERLYSTSEKEVNLSRQLKEMKQRHNKFELLLWGGPDILNSPAKPLPLTQH